MLAFSQHSLEEIVKRYRESKAFRIEYSDARAVLIGQKDASFRQQVGEKIERLIERTVTTMVPMTKDEAKKAFDTDVLPKTWQFRARADGKGGWSEAVKLFACAIPKRVEFVSERGLSFSESLRVGKQLVEGQVYGDFETAKKNSECKAPMMFTTHEKAQEEVDALKEQLAANEAGGDDMEVDEDGDENPVTASEVVVDGGLEEEERPDLEGLDDMTRAAILAQEATTKGLKAGAKATKRKCTDLTPTKLQRDTKALTKKLKHQHHAEGGRFLTKPEEDMLARGKKLLADLVFQTILVGTSRLGRPRHMSKEHAQKLDKAGFVQEANELTAKLVICTACEEINQIRVGGISMAEFQVYAKRVHDSKVEVPSTCAVQQLKRVLKSYYEDAHRLNVKLIVNALRMTLPDDDEAPIFTPLYPRTTDIQDMTRSEKEAFQISQYEEFCCTQLRRTNAGVQVLTDLVELTVQEGKRKDSIAPEILTNMDILYALLNKLSTSFKKVEDYILTSQTKLAPLLAAKAPWKLWYDELKDAKTYSGVVAPRIKKIHDAMTADADLETVRHVLAEVAELRTAAPNEVPGVLKVLCTLVGAATERLENYEGTEIEELDADLNVVKEIITCIYNSVEEAARTHLTTLQTRSNKAHMKKAGGIRMHALQEFMAQWQDPNNAEHCWKDPADVSEGLTFTANGGERMEKLVALADEAQGTPVTQNDKLLRDIIRECYTELKDLLNSVEPDTNGTARQLHGIKLLVRLLPKDAVPCPDWPNRGQFIAYDHQLVVLQKFEKVDAEKETDPLSDAMSEELKKLKAALSRPAPGESSTKESYVEEMKLFEGCRKTLKEFVAAASKDLITHAEASAQDKQEALKENEAVKLREEFVQGGDVSSLKQIMKKATEEGVLTEDVKTDLLAKFSQCVLAQASLKTTYTVWTVPQEKQDASLLQKLTEVLAFAKVTAVEFELLLLCKNRGKKSQFNSVRMSMKDEAISPASLLKATRDQFATFLLARFRP